MKILGKLGASLTDHLVALFLDGRQTMQIQQGGPGPTVGLPAATSNTPKAPAVSVRGNSGDPLVGGVEIVGAHADQLASLAGRLKDVPATRDDVVAQVRGRIEQGQYSTRDAAERTAASLRGK